VPAVAEDPEDKRPKTAKIMEEVKFDSIREYVGQKELWIE
jgi:hypothetical protein